VAQAVAVLALLLSVQYLLKLQPPTEQQILEVEVAVALVYPQLRLVLLLVALALSLFVTAGQLLKNHTFLMVLPNGLFRRVSVLLIIWSLLAVLAAAPLIILLHPEKQVVVAVPVV
jgi:hypothetical protein